MTFTIGEILEGLRDLTLQQALDHLRKNKSPTLWFLLKETLSPEEFDKGVLDTTFTYSLLPMGLAENNLYFEIKRLYIFKTTSVVALPRKKTIFIQILESLHRIESDIFLSVVSGTFYNRYVNLNPTDIRNLITSN